MKRIFPRKFRHLLLGWAARFGFTLGRIIPRKAGLALFSAVGTVCYYLLSKDRKRTIRNLRFVFGQEWGVSRIRAVSRAVFSALGKNFFDAVKLNSMSDRKFNRIVTCDSLGELNAVKASGRGMVVVTAHTGSFEMLLHFYARKGFDCFAVGRAFKNQAVDAVVRRMRSGPGIEYVDRSEDSRKIVRMLRQGKTMGVLIDQDTTKVEGVFADFLGHPAFTPSGAVRFAMKFDIPIFVLLTARLAGDKHHVFIAPQLTYVKTDNFEADLASVVQRINDIISSHIRKFPEQWVWMHERWKTKPPKREAVDK
jgi:KDO2-lipid IV(A) lauroyltransferase